MSIRIVPVDPNRVPELARICFDAFGQLQDRHGVERDFDSIDTAGMVVGLFASNPGVAGFTAMDGDRILGSNFISFTDPVSGVGPITVDPNCQSRGVGKLLMQAVLAAAKDRGVKEIRLQQEAINTTSLSLYTKLGFDWREACSLFKPAASNSNDPRVLPMSESDLPSVDAISKRHYGSTRMNEVAGFLKMQMPGFVLTTNGQATGYFVPGFLGHGFAETPADLAALVGHAMRNVPPMFQKILLPLGQNDLHRELMSAGGRSVKLFNYMTTGPYTRPAGAWLPSIGM